MKKYIIFFSIVSLVITTSIVKSSTRQLEKNIFIIEEEVKILEEKYDFLLLESDYLTTPERLIGLKEKIFMATINSRKPLLCSQKISAPKCLPQAYAVGAVLVSQRE